MRLPERVRLVNQSSVFYKTTLFSIMLSIRHKIPIQEVLIRKLPQQFHLCNHSTTNSSRNRSCVDFKLCLIDATDFVKCAHTASNYDPWDKPDLVKFWSASSNNKARTNNRWLLSAVISWRTLRKWCHWEAFVVADYTMKSSATMPMLMTATAWVCDEEQ